MTRNLQPTSELDSQAWVQPQPDTSEPHHMAVIANMARILPDKISAAETTALMYLAEHTVVDPEYNHHKILPVSGSLASPSTSY